MEPIIILKDVGLNYGNKNIFQGLNFTFYKKPYVLKGDSGIGKTSLLNLLAGYIGADQGTIEFTKKRDIAYLLQEVSLFQNLTTEENLIIKWNIMNQNEEHREYNFMELLEDFDLDFDLQHAKVSTLSGGEKQKLQLAILSMSNPNIVLLDEPITNLDQRRRKQITDKIYDTWSDRLLIVSSHDEIDFDNNYSEILLKDGKIYEK